MIDFPHSKTLLFTLGGLTFAAAIVVAQAQTVNSSPFAKKGKTQAWETVAQTPPPQPVTTGQPVPSGSYMPPATGSQPAQPYAAPTQTGNYSYTYQTPDSSSNPETLPAYQPQQTGSGYYQPGQAQSQSYPQPQYNPGYQAQQTQGYPAQQGAGGYPNTQQSAGYPNKRRNWFGLDNLATDYSGRLRVGAGATETAGDWREDFIVDAMIRGEVSAITQGGLEYGVGGKVRGQYDKYRRGFGGLVGDCPPTLAGCPSVLIGGTPTAIRGHTSQFYAFGIDTYKSTELALEGAYVFLRSAYGDISVGRDNGAAYLFSLGAPSLLSVGASNSPVDYTGLDAVKTVNDASGFAEKVTYTSPRMLGDTVGVGVQFGASYAPNARACGVDYCVQSSGKDGSGAISPDLEHIIEAGLSLARKFANGLSIEATATYAKGNEKSGIAAFDDLQALGLGLELGYDKFKLGGSWLDSNNGLADGDYSAWDVGATWRPSQWGFTAGYGQSKDKNIGLTSDQALFGLSYDWNENYRLGAGVQYIDRDVPFNVGGIITPTEEKATSVFIEGRVTF